MCRLHNHLFEREFAPNKFLGYVWIVDSKENEKETKLLLLIHFLRHKKMGGLDSKRVTYLFPFLSFYLFSTTSILKHSFWVRVVFRCLAELKAIRRTSCTIHFRLNTSLFLFCKVTNLSLFEFVVVKFMLKLKSIKQSFSTISFLTF